MSVLMFTAARIHDVIFRTNRHTVRTVWTLYVYTVFNVCPVTNILNVLLIYILSICGLGFTHNIVSEYQIYDSLESLFVGYNMHSTLSNFITFLILRRMWYIALISGINECGIFFWCRKFLAFEVPINVFLYVYVC